MPDPIAKPNVDSANPVAPAASSGPGNTSAASQPAPAPVTPAPAPIPPTTSITNMPASNTTTMPAGNVPLGQFVAGPATASEAELVKAEMAKHPGINEDVALGNIRMQPAFAQARSSSMTVDQKAAIDSMDQTDTSGIMDTKDFRQGVDAMVSSITTAKDNPLPHTSQVSANGEIIEDPDYRSAMDNIQSELDLVRSYNADPSIDPEIKMIEEDRTRLASRKAAAIQDIQARADEQKVAQKEANRQANARVVTMMASLGTLGSTQHLQYAQDTIASGEKALRDIAEAESRAVREAELAFEEGDLELMRDKMRLSEKRRRDYIELAMESFNLKKSVQEAIQQKQEFRIKMRQYERDDAKESLGLMLDAGATVADIPKETLARLEAQLALPAGTGAKYFETAQKAREVANAKDKAEKEKAQIELIEKAFSAAEKMPPGQGFDIPLPDGTTMRVNGMYDVAKDWKATDVHLPDGHYMFYTDSSGNIKNKVKFGGNYVAPQLDQDTGEWKVFNPMTEHDEVVFTGGEYGEGYSGMATAQQYVESDLVKRFGKPTQEPGGGFSHNHLTGWDFAAPANSPLTSPINGVVVSTNFFDKNIDPRKTGPSKSNNDYGNFVDVMDQSTGAIFRFAHLSNIGVQLGQTVGAGTQLGRTGNTGYSTGPHVHFEVRDSENHAITPNRNAPDAAAHYDAQPEKPVASSPDIEKFQKETGYTYNPKSKRSQDQLVVWTKEQRGKEEALRKTTLQQQQNLQSSEPTKLYDKAYDAYKTIAGSVDQVIASPETAGVNDLAILTAYARSLDPNTGVRDAEFNNMASSLGELKRLGMLPTKWFKGDRLTPEGRKSFASSAKSQFEQRQNTYFDTIALEVGNARREGYDPVATIPPRVFQEYIKARGITLVNPNAPAGQQYAIILDESDPEYQELTAQGYRRQ